MIVSIRGGGTGKGYGNYVLRQNKPKEKRDNVYHLKGDIELGDRIVDSSNYKDNAYNIVLGFKEQNISIDQANAVLSDFERLFMHGFNEDEYHLDAIFHKDSNHNHIHIRIPKLNLLTGTTLRLYYDKNDRKRVNLIRDYIEQKHGLDRVQDNQKLVPQDKAEIISKWRAERGQNPFDFSKKKGRDKAQKEIISYLAEVHEAGLINSLDDVKSLVQDLDLNIVKTGHDIKSDFHYITVANDTGKIRLKGEIFNERFYTDYKAEDRQEQIRTNRSAAKHDRGNENSFERTKRELGKALAKRRKAVRERYRAAREKAKQSIERTVGEAPDSDNRVQGNEREADQERQVGNEQPVHSDNNTLGNSNSVTGVSNIQAMDRERTVDSSETVQAHSKTQESNDRTDRRHQYDYVSERRLRLHRIRQGRKIDATVGRRTTHSTGKDRRTREERSSSYERFREARAILYTKAQRVVPIRRERRATRERYRTAIDAIRGGISEFKEVCDKFTQKVGNTAGYFHEITAKIGQKIDRIVENSQKSDKKSEKSLFDRVENAINKEEILHNIEQEQKSEHIPDTGGFMRP